MRPTPKTPIQKLTQNLNNIQKNILIKKTKNNKSSGFTLVELIVVITILVILGTIGFTSMSSFSSNARDSSRSSDLANLSKALELTYIKTGSYPDPEDSFLVTYSGGTLWKQGIIGDTTLNIINAGGGIKLSSKPTDPLTTTKPYTYSKTYFGNFYQLKADWEGDSITYDDVRCKMKDDKIKMEECKENLVENSSLIPSYIFHFSSFTFPEVSASPGNPTLTYIRGNYNGMVARTETGSMKYLLAIPSLFLGNNASSGSTVNFSPITQTGFLLHGQSNSSTGFVFTGVVVYSSGALPSTTAERILFASGIANAYSGTILASSSSIKPFIIALSSNSTGSLASLGGSVVSGSLGGSTTSSSSSQTSTTVRGEIIYNTPGTFSWAVPAGVTNVSVVCVGGGAGKSGTPGGGGGGALVYQNNIVVTSGGTFQIIVGAGGTSSEPLGLDSWIGTTAQAQGGRPSSISDGVGGIFLGGSGGGNGGKGKYGGGGAGGYSGNGGNAATGDSGNGLAGNGGGGGGGGGSGGANFGGGGGGVGLFGEGTNGSGGGSSAAHGGKGGSNGVDGNWNGAQAGGTYGGGAGWGNGGNGACRIIWPGTTRQFPFTDVGP